MEPKSHPVTAVLLANTDFGNKNTWKVQTRHPNHLHAFPTPEDVTTQQIIFDGNIPQQRVWYHFLWTAVSYQLQTMKPWQQTGCNLKFKLNDDSLPSFPNVLTCKCCHCFVYCSRLGAHVYWSLLTVLQCPDDNHANAVKRPYIKCWKAH